MSDKWNLKWLPPPSWIYNFCLLVKFGIILVKWSIFGGSQLHHSKILFIYVNRRLSYCCLCHHPELQFCNAAPPTKSICAPKIPPSNFVLIECVLFEISRFKNFENLAQNAYLGPQNHVFEEFWPANIIFYYRDPQKALPYTETRVLSHKRSWSVFWCDL